MQEITLRGMRFHALVGILPHERSVAQPIEIDLAVIVDEEGGGAVVDYRALYDAAAAALAPAHTDHLEEIADRALDGALAVSPRIRSARVAVRKPNVALPGPLDYAEVAAQRTAAR